MHIYALIYLAVISLFAFILTLHDKNAARRNAWRVKERILLAVSALGGSAAMLLTMLAVLPLKPDIVLSGHTHGGQWRIPFVLENGLLSPNQGLFPKYTNGEYFFGYTELIVSRGLARESTAVPRVFNSPEIVVITLEKAV